MTWVDLTMYLASIPKYKSDKDAKKKIIAPEDEDAIFKQLGV